MPYSGATWMNNDFRGFQYVLPLCDPSPAKDSEQRESQWITDLVIAHDPYYGNIAITQREKPESKCKPRLSITGDSVDLASAEGNAADFVVITDTGVNKGLVRTRDVLDTSDVSQYECTKAVLVKKSGASRPCSISILM